MPARTPRCFTTALSSLASVVGILAAAAGAHGQICISNEYLINGSFESPVIANNSLQRIVPTGWTVGGTSIGFLFRGINPFPWPAPAPAAGSQFFDMGNASPPISQTFTAAESLRFTLTWSDAAAIGSVSSPYRVRIYDPAGQVVREASFNAGNNGIWTPRSLLFRADPGVYRLEFQPTGVFGGFDTLLDNVSLVNQPVLTFFREPRSQRVCPGDTATFFVDIDGPGPITYQWRKNGVFIDPAVNPSAATRELVIPNVQAADLGNYDCLIGNSCALVSYVAASLTLFERCGLADVVGSFGGGTQCGDSTVDGSDFIAFINSFSIGDATIDPLADVAGAGDDGLEPDGTIDGSDFIAFINAFALGC